MAWGCISSNIHWYTNPPEEREGKRENRKKTVECERLLRIREHIVLTESEKQIIVYAGEQNL